MWRRTQAQIGTSLSRSKRPSNDPVILPSAYISINSTTANLKSRETRSRTVASELSPPPIVRDEVYRIAREALRNAFSHARASHIEAEISYGEHLFRLRIRDDGEGIAPAMLEEGRPGHYGLPGMRERAAEIGAKLDIWSGAGTGTEIDLSIAGLDCLW